MLRQLLRRHNPFNSSANHGIVSKVSSFCSSYSYGTSKENTHGTDFSLLELRDRSCPDRYQIDVVDADTWRVTTGLAHSSKSVEQCEWELGSLGNEGGGDEEADEFVEAKHDLDYDDIEDMRVHGRLFYKIDRGSREFEEYKFDFHRRKSYSRNKDKDDDEASNGKETSTSSLPSKAHKTEKRKDDSTRVNPTMPLLSKGQIPSASFRIDVNASSDEKKQRKPSFNQLTGPYHEPFCLDIFVSKESIRACIVHRVTSKVVAVAHSISKDMKFDIGSTKSVKAGAAVGKVLAQRALADDIHNVNFTPRKGDELKGKLMLVLKSVMDNGVNVKVKLKQRQSKGVRK